MKKKKNKSQLHVYEGNEAIVDYLNPQNFSYTPLVELPSELNPYKRYNVRIFAKLMNALPLRNIKSVPAYNMLIQAKKNKQLQNVKNIIEPSSGNTVLSMAPLARNIGIHSINALIPEYVKMSKLKILQLFGVNIIVYKDPTDRSKNNAANRINTAKRIAKKKQWFNPSQYDNPHNPEIHEHITGPQIWEQTHGKISIFCSGVGSSGTIVGTTKFLKSKNEKLLTIGITGKENKIVPGVRSKKLLQELSFKWKEAVDTFREIDIYDAYKASLKLIRYGIVVGPSSGLSYSGLLSYLKDSKFTKKKNKKEIIAVFMCFDEPYSYIDEYFEVLKSKEFPEIQHGLSAFA